MDISQQNDNLTLIRGVFRDALINGFIVCEKEIGPASWIPRLFGKEPYLLSITQTTRLDTAEERELNHAVSAWGESLAHSLQEQLIQTRSPEAKAAAIRIGALLIERLDEIEESARVVSDEERNKFIVAFKNDLASLEAANLLTFQRTPSAYLLNFSKEALPLFQQVCREALSARIAPKEAGTTEVAAKNIIPFPISGTGRS